MLDSRVDLRGELEGSILGQSQKRRVQCFPWKLTWEAEKAVRVVGECLNQDPVSLLLQRSGGGVHGGSNPLFCLVNFTPFYAFLVLRTRLKFLAEIKVKMGSKRWEPPPPFFTTSDTRPLPGLALVGCSKVFHQIRKVCIALQRKARMNTEQEAESCLKNANSGFRDVALQNVRCSTSQEKFTFDSSFLISHSEIGTGCNRRRVFAMRTTGQLVSQMLTNNWRNPCLTISLAKVVRVGSKVPEFTMRS